MSVMRGIVGGCWIACFALSSATLRSASAEPPVTPFPQVLSTAPGVALYDGERVTYRIPAGQVLDVLQADGDWLWVGRGWLRKNEAVAIDEAAAFFSARIEQEPTPFDLVSRARARFHAQDFAAARDDCNQALRLDPKHALALTMRGRCAAEQGDKLAASIDLGAAIRLDRTSAIPYLYRGCLYLQHHELDLALRDLDRALTLDPLSAQGLSARGRVRAAWGDAIEAQADFTAALAIHPYYVPAYNSRANLAFRAGHYNRAIHDYSQAIQLAPTHAELYLNRALAHERLRQPTAAMSDVDEAIRLQPTSAAYQIRARLRLAAGQVDAATHDRRMAESLVRRVDRST